MTTSNQLVWVLAALSFLTTMAVVAHIMAKWKHATPIRMDDYMAIAARVRYVRRGYVMSSAPRSGSTSWQCLLTRGWRTAQACRVLEYPS
jgi:hypothetical protein